MFRKTPLAPDEMIRREKDLPEIMKWSRKKHLIVEGPEFWGIHHVYIADDLKQVAICLKENLTTHVFIGIPTHAEEWRRYRENIELHFSRPLERDALQWAIYKDYVLYRGKMLPPKDIPEEPYMGEVIDIKTWNGEISDDWIINNIKYIYTL